VIPLDAWLVDSTTGGTRFKIIRIVDSETVEMVDDAAVRRVVNRRTLETQLANGEVKEEKGT